MKQNLQNLNNASKWDAPLPTNLSIFSISYILQVAVPAHRQQGQLFGSALSAFNLKKNKENDAYYN